jgi:tetratricopeptide (TPR) repeat protein
VADGAGAVSRNFVTAAGAGLDFFARLSPGRSGQPRADLAGYRHEAASFAGMKRLCLALIVAGAALAATEPVLGEAEGHYRSGKRAVQHRDYAGAVEQLERAVALAPRESDYHHWLGNSYAWAATAAPLCDKSALGRKCLAAYQRALELAPDNLSARFSLMNFYRHVPRLLGGGPARATAEAVEICRRDPVQGAYARAVLLGDEKKYRAAFAALAEVLRQQPDHYAANCLFGRLALASGERVPEGAAALRRCLQLVPTETDESHDAVARWLGQLPGPGSLLSIN